MPRLGSLLDNAAQLSLRQTTSRLAGWSLSACNSSLSTTRRAVSAVAGPGKTESDLEKRGRTRRHHGPLFASSMRSSVGSARPFLTSAPRKMAKPLPDAPAAGSSQAVYTTKTRRIGLIASKKGMMTFFDEWGQQVAVTVLKVGRLKRICFSAWWRPNPLYIASRSKATTSWPTYPAMTESTLLFKSEPLTRRCAGSDAPNAVFSNVRESLRRKFLPDFLLPTTRSRLLEPNYLRRILWPDNMWTLKAEVSARAPRVS